jgi:uncharacterized RDD family membrane protein YckC
MFCSKCGATAAEGTAFCGSCGQPMVGYSVAQSTAAPYAAGVGGAASVVVAAGGSAYAGFWLRFVATLIDGIISVFVVAIIIALWIGIIGIGPLREQFEEMGRGLNGPAPVFPAMLVVALLTFFVFMVIVTWLYFAGMESSSHQGTLGKMALGLVVTDMEGRRVSFGRASGRFWGGRGISNVPSIGGLYFLVDCIMAGCTEKKQALHDIIASCLVLRKA